MKNKIILLFLFIATSAFADLSNYQKQILKICEKYGKLIDYPETLMAIAFNESTAGKASPVQDVFLKPFTRSYGIMNVRLPTAKLVIEKGYVNFEDTDEYLLIKLIQDPEFNIAVAAGYLKYIQDNFTKKSKDPWLDMVIAYNAGPGNINRFKRDNKMEYVNKTKKHIEYIRELYANNEL